MNSIWIIFALLSGLFVSAREIYIKRYINYPAEIVGFTTRFFGSILLLIIALQSRIMISNLPLFAAVTLATVIITAIATTTRLRLIKKEDISLTTPWLGTIPAFMVIWTAILYGELPGWLSFLGILMVCLGSFSIGLKGKSFHLNKASLIMIAIAAMLGLTTSIDKLAIMASSAITYSLIWTISSAVLMYGVAKKSNQRVFIIDKHLIVQAIFWVGEFLCQMYAVQYAEFLDSGTTYVKSLTMINIMSTILFGGILFKEFNIKKRLLSSLLIFTGAVIIVLFRTRV